MIAARCNHRRRGHGLLRDHARDNVLRLLDLGLPGRFDVVPADSGDQRCNSIVGDVFQIGVAADVTKRDRP